MNRIYILISLIVLVVLSSCNSEHHHEEIESTFKVTTPEVKDTNVFRTYVCQISSINHIEPRSQERGYLEHVYVDEGQFVKKGQLMFKIMPLIYQAETQKAQAEVDFAKIE